MNLNNLFEAANPAQQAAIAISMKKSGKKPKSEDVAEEKVRLDPKCWTGKKIGNPKTKVKGGVRVNNCVPAESINEFAPPGGSDGDSGRWYTMTTLQTSLVMIGLKTLTSATMNLTLTHMAKRPNKI